MRDDRKLEDRFPVFDVLRGSIPALVLSCPYRWMTWLTSSYGLLCGKQIALSVIIVEMYNKTFVYSLKDIHKMTTL